MQYFHQFPRSLMILVLLIFMFVIGFSGIAVADKQVAEEKAPAAEEKAEEKAPDAK